MASEFLKQRFAAMLKARAGDETVAFVPFNASSRDDLTGDVDEDAAYAATPILLPALVEFNPSQALRDKIGVDVRFDAVLTIATEHLATAGITLSIGDAFTLPGQDVMSKVTKVMPDMQCGSDFIATVVAVSRIPGER